MKAIDDEIEIAGGTIESVLMMGSKAPEARMKAFDDGFESAGGANEGV